MGESLAGAELRVFSIPLTIPFRGITAREGVLIKGPAGWGEWSPFVEYDDATSVAWLLAAREAAAADWPVPVRARVPLNAIVPAVGPDAAFDIAATTPHTTIKVKVGERGQTLADDLARVEAVRRALRGRSLDADGRIRVDVNGAWTVAEAVERIAALNDAADGLEYVEQPCASVEELAAVRRETDVLIAADESIRRAEDPYRVRELEAADIAVLKVQPLGGVRACREIARDIGLPVVVSSALETPVGLAAGLMLAAALPHLPYACGLASDALFAVDFDPDDPTSCPAPPEREQWWRERFARVSALAEQQLRKDGES